MRLLIASFAFWFAAGYLFNAITTPHETCEKYHSANVCNYSLK